MHFSSNAKQFVLLLIVGIFLLLGYVVFNHFNERQNMVWFDASKRDIPVDEDQRNTSLSKPIFRSRVQNIVSPERLLYKQPSVLVGRTDVVAVTPWLAPIVWEGTFDPNLVDIIYKSMNLTIATTVFAVGKYMVFNHFNERQNMVWFDTSKIHIPVDEDQRNTSLSPYSGAEYRTSSLRKGVDAASGVVNTTEEEVEGVDSQSPCPAGWHQNEHRCFSFYPVWATWATAESYCSQHRGNLVSVHSPGQQMFVQDLVRRHTYQPVWIGGYDAAQEGMWLWSDGSAVDSFYWEEDEPSNSGQGENCMELHTGGGQGWNDVSCGELRFYVCSMETRSGLAALPSQKKAHERCRNCFVPLPRLDR